MVNFRNNVCRKNNVLGLKLKKYKFTIHEKRSLVVFCTVSNLKRYIFSLKRGIDKLFKVTQAVT